MEQIINYILSKVFMDFGLAGLGIGFVVFLVMQLTSGEDSFFISSDNNYLNKIRNGVLVCFMYMLGCFIMAEFIPLVFIVIIQIFKLFSN